MGTHSWRSRAPMPTPRHAVGVTRVTAAISVAIEVDGR